MHEIQIVMENIEFTRFIERYLDDKMQSSEKRWFEKEMEGNLWLRKELELRRKANELASNFDAVKLREKLQNAELKHRNTSVLDKAVKKVPVNYAAIFVGLIVISTLLILTGNRMDLQSYTADSLDSYNASTKYRSGNIDTPNQVITGMEFYYEGKYNEAIKQFEQLIIDNQSTMQSNLHHAMANMKISNYTEAIKYFDIVLDHGDNSFGEEASYFKGLCYINTKEDEKAKVIMEGILSSKSRYKKDAKKILKNID